jgi:DnaJ-class molecular chaperone
MSEFNPYEILEIKPNSTIEEIKKAYRKMMLKYHPDKNKSDDAPKKFNDVKIAYEVLCNPKRKQEYDDSNKETKQEIYDLFKDLIDKLPTTYQYPTKNVLYFLYQDNEKEIREDFDNLNIMNMLSKAKNRIFNLFTAPIVNTCTTLTKMNIHHEILPAHNNKYDIIETLNITLADRYSTLNKKVKITKKIIDNGTVLEKKHIRKIPLYKARHIIMKGGDFNKKTNECGHLIVDIVMKSDNSQYEIINLVGLGVTIPITLKKFLTEKTIDVVLPDNTTYTYDALQEFYHNGTTHKIAGKGGFPRSETDRGDLFIKFEVVDIDNYINIVMKHGAL